MSKQFSARRGFTLVEVFTTVCIVGILLCLSLPAVQAVRKAAEGVERLNWRRQRILDDPPPRRVPYRILFIGNSHTSHENIDIPDFLAALSAKRAEVRATKVTVDGQTLEGHWEAGEASDKIPEESGDWWDFVVLQDQSRQPCLDYQSCVDYTVRFAAVAKENRAIPLVYQLFEREDGLCPQDKLTGASMNALKLLQGNDGVGEVCPVGEAWRSASSQRPDLEMRQPDGNHANETGGYLTACVFYAVVHRESPVGLPNSFKTPSGEITIDAADAAFLQGVAWETSEKWRRKTRAWFLKGKAD
jgi:hypothetical protein